MKRRLIFSVLCALFVGFNNQACQAECKAVCGNGSMINKITAGLSSFGHKIENVQFPAVGKLGNILPIAVMAFCLKKFPGQTMALLSCGLMYALYCNEKVCGVIGQYIIVKSLKNRMKTENTPREDFFEDSFFVFSGEDMLDAEQEEEDEDDLLDDSLNGDVKSFISAKKALSFL